jgi:hypothetical protein
MVLGLGGSSRKIDVTETGIRIHDVRVENREVAKYVSALPPDQREQAVVDAIKVGVLCLERARAGQDLDFVRREVESVLTRVKEALRALPEETQKQVADQIGTAEGQVLAPIATLVNEVKNAASEKIEGIRSLLIEEVDPARESSALGKALRALRDLLDPRRTDSVQGSIDAAVKQVTGESGPLAKAVKEVVSDALKPLEEKVTQLAKDVSGKEAVAAALEQTPQKGASFEEEVVVSLNDWGQGLGAEVHHVGTDNQPGDVLVVLQDTDASGSRLRLVAEARDRQTPAGRKAISDCLNEAMTTRGANSAIYVSKTRAGLAREIGEWAEGNSAAGCWVACTHEHLATAVRFLFAQERLRQLRATVATLDTSGVEGQIQRIRTSLGKIINIKTKITNIRAATGDIESEAESLRDDIRGALSLMEDGLRVGRNKGEASTGGQVAA